jgi:hypothetical protein
VVSIFAYKKAFNQLSPNNKNQNNNAFLFLPTADADARQLLLERPSTNTTATVEEEVATLFDKW